MDSDNDRPSFRFRDKYHRLKDKLKYKVKDKAIKHNITYFIHQNLTATDTPNDYSQTTRHGFRGQMHHMKDVLKNKTHYDSFKQKIKGKIDENFDIHDNKTYPKGFYDSLFSPETENDVYLQTALMCLWVIALLCIIPTLVIVFLPLKKKKTSTNMIFLHVFLCEICYLFYIFLAMINVSKDFRLASFLCDIANYGMYVTIPIMQFALLFLSLERLSNHFELPMTWAKIFKVPYLIQVILCAIWIILIASVATVMFIRKQFTFSFFKDKVNRYGPPIIGDVVSRLATRRHHCSIDGRLSSVFKVVIIILFILLIVKPIMISLGLNLLTPVCCKKRRKETQRHGDRRLTTLVTIVLLLNLFFSFPYYFVSMFKNVLANIDATKDTFGIILKICFILRISNIIFECLAFYIFERNSWSCLSTICYYATCKKCPMLKSSPDDDVLYTKDPEVLDLIKRTRSPSGYDEQNHKKPTKKQRKTKEPEVKPTESEPDDDDDNADGSFKHTNRKQSKPIRAQTPDDSDNDQKATKKRKQGKSVQTTDNEEENTSKKKRKPVEKDESDEEEEEPEPKVVNPKKPKHTRKHRESEDDDEEEHEKIHHARRKSHPQEKVRHEQPKSKSRKSHNEIRHHSSSSATSEANTASNASRESSPSKPVVKHHKTKRTRRTSNPRHRPRSISPNESHSRHQSPPSQPRVKVKPSTHHHHHHKTKTHVDQTKPPKKDRRTTILEMSADV